MTVDPAEYSTLLTSLEATWQSHGALIVQRLRQGLRMDEVDRKLGDAGLTAPTELRLLWAWHDGTERSTGQDVAVGGNGMIFLSLDRALTERERRLEMAGLLEQDDDPRAGEDGLWPRSWLPIGQFGNGDVAAVDCATPPGDPTPIRQVGWDAEDFKEPKLPSLSAMIQMFIDLMALGAWTWDVEAHRWRTDFDLIPMEYRITSLV